MVGCLNKPCRSLVGWFISPTLTPGNIVIGQFMYLREVFWTNVFIGCLVFESSPRPVFDLGIGAWGCGLNWGWHVFGWDWSISVLGVDWPLSCLSCTAVRKFILFSPVCYFLSDSFCYIVCASSLSRVCGVDVGVMGGCV